MLKFFNTNKKNSIHQLEIYFKSRKLKQQTQSAVSKKNFIECQKKW